MWGGGNKKQAVRISWACVHDFLGRLGNRKGLSVFGKREGGHFIQGRACVDDGGAMVAVYARTDIANRSRRN